MQERRSQHWIATGECSMAEPTAVMGDDRTDRCGCGAAMAMAPGSAGSAAAGGP